VAAEWGLLSFIPKSLSEEAEPFFMLLWFAKVDWFVLQIATSAHTRNQIFWKSRRRSTN
jgi:hypothetical protein